MRVLIFTKVLILISLINAKAQRFYFRHYEVETGLSNNTIFCVTQDRDGFLWLGSKDGLNRFDGHQFKSFPLPNTDPVNLSRDLISALAIDSVGRLWVGSEKGLYRYEARSERLLPFMDSLKAINDIYVSSKGELWFISSANIHCHNFKTNKQRVYPSEKYFEATSLCETETGEMWFSSTNGFLYRLDESKKAFAQYSIFHSDAPKRTRWIEKIAADKRGSLYIGTTGHGIKKFNLASLSYSDLIKYNDDLTAIHVRDILMPNPQEVWFATESGLFILDVNSGKFQNIKKRFLDPYSLSDNAIYTLFKDREDGIWAGTYFGGVNYLPHLPITFQKFFPDYSSLSLSGNAVREICQDKFGNLWVGTEDAGLNRLNPLTKEVKRFLPGGAASISNSNIHALLPINNTLWIGTFEHGLNIMDIASGQVKKRYRAGDKENCLRSDFIICLLQTTKGIIYIGTSNGLFIYNKKTDDFSPEKNIPSGFITSIMEDSQGRLWALVHNQGVYYYDQQGTGHYSSEPGKRNGLPNNSINSIFEDSSHNIWFSTDGGGLCQLNKDRKKFSRYTTQEGLPSNLVYKILEDDLKNLWITTSRGLVCMNNQTNALTTFSKADGLLSDQFNYSSGYKDKNGKFYFGSVRGLIAFDPAISNASKFTPRLFITDIEIHHNELKIGGDSPLKQSILYTNAITLPYDQSSLSFDYAAVSFSAPEKTICRYRLLGLDSNWVSIQSHRKIYFTKLIAGNYTLQLETGGNLFLGRQQKSLHITILPPLWGAGWAYLLYALIATALLVYIINLYHKIQEDKKEKAIYDAKIEFFTNITHEIRTPLTLIKVPVDNLIDMKASLPQISDDVVTMERNTIRLINLVNQILDFRKVEEKGFSLDFKEVNLTDLLKEIFLTFEPSAQKKKLDYALHLPPRIVNLSGDEEALIKILSNLVNNAVKYAERKVSVTLRQPLNHENVVVEVRNDGLLISQDMKEKVFEPFFRMKEATQQKGTGMGLALARSLAELHKGKLYLDTNSYDMNTFILEIPTANLTP